MSKKVIGQITAAIVLVLAVVSVMFGAQIGGMEPTAEGYAFIGIIIGGAATFLFQTNSRAMSNFASP